MHQPNRGLRRSVKVISAGTASAASWTASGAPRRDQYREDARRQPADGQRHREVAYSDAATRPSGRSAEITGTPRTNNERVLENAVEQQRCGERVEQAAEHAAERQPEVELRQVRCFRPILRKLGVAVQRQHCKRSEVQRDDGRERTLHARHHEERERHDGERQRTPRERADSRRAAAEGEHERDEIQRERHDPQERHRADVGGDVTRHREHQARRHERQRDPSSAAHPRQRARRPARTLRRSGVPALCASAPGNRRAGDGEQHELGVAGRPQTRLLAQREHRFDDGWIGGEGEQASEVAR